MDEWMNQSLFLKKFNEKFLEVQPDLGKNLWTKYHHGWAKGLNNQPSQAELGLNRFIRWQMMPIIQQQHG